MKINNLKALVKIPLIYAIFALAWIFFSDRALALLTDDSHLITSIQTVKGILFVLTSAVIILMLVYNELKTIEEKNDHIKSLMDKQRIILENLQEGIFIIFEGKVIFANKNITEITGHTNDEITGSLLTDLFIPEEKELLQNILSDMGHPKEIVLYLIKADRTNIPVEIHSVKINWNGQDSNILFLFDISESVESQQKIESQKKFFEQVFHQSNSSEMILDTNGKCLKINKHFKDIFNVGDGILEGRYSIFDDAGFINAGSIYYVKKAYKGEVSQWELEYDTGNIARSFNIENDNSRNAWFRAKVYPIFDEKNKVDSIILQLEEITEEKKALDLIAENEARLRTIAENFPNGSILLFNRDLRYIFVDGQNLKQIGLDKNKMLGKLINEVFEGEVQKQNAYYYGLTLKGIASSYELAYGDKYFEIRTVPVLKNNEVICGLVITQDITVRKMAEFKLLQMNDELETRVEERTQKLRRITADLEIEIENHKISEVKLKNAQSELKELLEKEKDLNEMKTSFISTVSHEYRTPLTLILTSTYLLEQYFKSSMKDEFQNQIEKIKHSVSSMTQLLNDVLLMGKNEAGLDSINLQVLDIERLLMHVVDDVRITDDNQHSIILKTNLTSPEIEADQQILQQIATNLISNAAKYSPKNTVINIELFDTSTHIHLKISDEGIGIMEQDSNKLFNAFYRGSNVGKISGTGLGLAIVKKCVNSLHGELDYVSQFGKGSVFSVKLPKKHEMPG